MAIAQEERDPIVEIMQQTPPIPDGCQWAIFLRNHDELTLEMVTSRERDYMYSTYAADKRARINLGIRRRLAPLMDNDKDRIKLMNGMLLSMPGSPVLYYGDEIGMGDNVFIGDRNGVRTPMQWAPDRNAGFSRADPQRLYLPPIMDAMYGYEAVNVEAQLRDNSSLLHWTRRMLAVRKTSSAFGRGKKTFLRPGNRKILAYLSEYDEDVILTVFNLSRAAQPVELDLAAFAGRVPVEMLGRVPFPPIGELPYLLTLASYGFYWFKLTTDTPVPVWHQGDVALRDLPTLVLFDGWNSVFRDRVMPWRMAMAETLREQVETDVLARHVEAQRWYAGKGTAIGRAAIARHVVWQQGTSEWMLSQLDVRAGDAQASYFLPLAIAWEDGDEERTKRLAPASISKVRQQAEVGLMADAFYDEHFCRALVLAIARGERIAGEHGEIRFTSTGALDGVTEADIAALDVSRPGVASSNTVVTLGDQLFLKGYRHLHDGQNPEFEVGRYLTQTARFASCVPVAGAMEFHGNDGRIVTLALLQAFVPNQGDAWEFTLAYLDRLLTEQAAPAEDGVTAPYDHGVFLRLMRTLGQRTAEMHLAFARSQGDAAFDPVPVSETDYGQWREQVATQARASLAMLRERASGLAPEMQGDIERLLARQERLLGRIEAAGVQPGAPGIKSRTHGDYHLGQVLVARNDFIIIDFEGEPARSFEERRTKTSPLRDVAGMLRSFNYAHWAALRRTAQNAEELERFHALAAEWEHAVRAAFIGGYVDAYAAAGAAPPDFELLALFELDKAMYELRYELNNRIDWVQVPLQGLLALSDAARDASPITHSAAGTAPDTTGDAA